MRLAADSQVIGNRNDAMRATTRELKPKQARIACGWRADVWLCSGWWEMRSTTLRLCRGCRAAWPPRMGPGDRHRL